MKLNKLIIAILALGAGLFVQHAEAGKEVQWGNLKSRKKIYNETPMAKGLTSHERAQKAMQKRKKTGKKQLLGEDGVGIQQKHLLGEGGAGIQKEEFEEIELGDE